jgi:DNA polymerase III subunit gamma/tau
MLSGAAFNALLKTLEEPPPHAKFIFATTEIRKVPITVLSRCQRFDLRRVDAAVLVEHLQGIAKKEKIKVDAEALALIARAAEGSVRDALSLFDQAIAHAAGPVRAEDVRGMLGLADRTRVIDLFEALMRADVARALSELRDQYDTGADPAMVLGDLAEFTHFVTRLKIVPALADDVSLTETERTRGRAFAAKLSMRVLARTWQMLLKGIAEVEAAGRPLAAAEMVLVRIAYAADLPTPDEVVRSLGDTARGNGAGAAAPGPASGTSAAAPRAEMRTRPEPRGTPRAALAAAAPAAISEPRGEASSAPVLTLGSFTELVALAGEKRDLAVKSALERDVRLVRFEDGKLEVALDAGAPKTLVGELSKKLSDWTRRRWMVIVSSEAGEPTLWAQAQTRKAELKDDVQSDPLVRAVLKRFPGAEIVEIRPPPEAPAASPDELPLLPRDDYEEER